MCSAYPADLECSSPQCPSRHISCLMVNPWMLQVRVEVESLADGVDLSEPLTRARFEELVGDLLKKTLGPVRKVRARRRALFAIAPHALNRRQALGRCH